MFRKKIVTMAVNSIFIISSASPFLSFSRVFILEINARACSRRVFLCTYRMRMKCARLYIHAHLENVTHLVIRCGASIRYRKSERDTCEIRNTQT